MLNQITQLLPERTDWNCLSAPHSLSELVVAAWQVGIKIARRLVESQLEALGQARSDWAKCSGCGTTLVSKGFAKRQMLTLLGSLSWQRRVGRCRRGCNSSGCIPLDTQLGIDWHQQSSTELHRLGSLLAVYLPYETAAQLLKQLVGIPLSAQTLWHWVQQAGHALEQPAQALDEVAATVESVAAEALAPEIAQLPLVIGADGITVPFRSQAGTPCGAVVGREVKVGVIAHLEQQVREADKVTHRLHQRRLVAHLGALETFAEKLKQEASRQGLFNTTLAAWISDGATGLWRVYHEQFEAVAVGILDFYHAVEHLAQAAQVDPCGGQGRTPEQWLKRMRYQLRHGFVHRIIKELHQLSQYPSTPDATQAVLRRVHDYLQTHQAHLDYPQFRQQGLPIGSGMVESACKWLIAGRFKGTGMRWSTDGFNRLLQLRLAWVNQRFEALFSRSPLVLSLYGCDLNLIVLVVLVESRREAILVELSPKLIPSS